MALTVAQAIARARITFPEMDTTTALDLLNDVWVELCGKYNLRDDELWVDVDAEDDEFTLAETAIKIQKAHWYTDAVNYRALGIFDEEEADRMEPNWRGADSGTPYRYTISNEISGDTSVKTFKYDKKPDTSTLVITDATNASPIVLTTSTAHELEDGSRIRPINVGGNTNANVLAYAKVTGYSTTTCGMYSDSDLTTAIAGNSAYTSGGHLVGPSSPGLRLYLQRATAFDSTDSLPNRLLNSDIIVRGLRKKWAEAIHPIEVIQRETVLYTDALHAFEGFRSQETEGRGVSIMPYHYVPRRVT